MADTVRVMRVLVYEGTRESVERTLANGGVPATGEHRVPNGSLVIKSAIIGQFPEVIDGPAVEPLEEDHF